ncbi:hypothetical protein TWF173_005148 [Orbilia oligospora]|nr:hypothetical protein TWF173_005148 [Orbilia oligospora]
MATGPPAGTAARLQYLMENQEWPVRVNGDKIRDHYWNCLYETRVATHCFASQLPPIPPQNPATRPRASTTTAFTENSEVHASRPTPSTEWVHRHTIQIRYLGDGAVEDYKMFSRDQHPEGGN